MDIALTPATGEDLELLIRFMRQLREDDPEEGAFDEAAARGAVAALLQRPEYGRIWLIRADGTTVGYVVLTFAYSIEFGGRMGVVDELFVARSHRMRGLGRAALAFVEAQAAKMQLGALFLEVTRGNARARAIYGRAGYAARPHQAMIRRVSRAGEA